MPFAEALSGIFLCHHEDTLYLPLCFVCLLDPGCHHPRFISAVWWRIAMLVWVLVEVDLKMFIEGNASQGTQGGI